MKAIIREPGKGYLDRWLWLPKSEVSQNQLLSALLYKVNNTKFIKAWREAPHHWLVPRNYVSQDRRQNLSFELIDARVRDFPKIDIKSSLVLDAQRPDLSFQRESVVALQSTYDGILCLRCGGGKSPIALHAAAGAKCPILVVVDEKGLAVQWKNAVRQFITTGDPVIGEVGDGKRDWKHDITIASVRTLARMAEAGEITPEMSRHFGIIIYDEVQVMGAPFFNTAVGEFHGRRWGLSATPDREDAYDSLLRYGIGPVVYTYLMPEQKPHFYFFKLPTAPFNTVDDDRARAHGGRFHYAMAYGILAENHRRTALIAHEVQTAISKGRSALVLSTSKAMCQALAQALPGSGLVTGDVSGKKRIERINKCNPVVAIMKVGEKALDKAGLDTVFIVDPIAKMGRIQQIMGRALRIKPGKMHPVVIMFEDYNIKPLRTLCNRMRSTLRQWPAEQGGAIGYRTLTPGHERKDARPQISQRRRSLRQ